MQFFHDQIVIISAQTLTFGEIDTALKAAEKLANEGAPHFAGQISCDTRAQKAVNTVGWQDCQLQGIDPYGMKHVLLLIDNDGVPAYYFRGESIVEGGVVKVHVTKNLTPVPQPW